MNLTSPAFQDNKPIPSRFAKPGICGGANISPPLHWTDPPPQTGSFALSIIDLHPDVPDWVHWLVINIPSRVTSLSAGASPSGIPNDAIELFNSFGDKGYGGPQPNPGSGIHRYLITLYALSVEALRISHYTSLPTLRTILKSITISSASITGFFER
jgi:Raf kinase inhibitor-like YbhB/YbcL family protein